MAGMRNRSFGQNYTSTLVDKAGIWLSNRRIVSLAKKNRPERTIDIGCGYNATALNLIKDFTKKRTAVDVSLNPTLKDIVKIERAIGEDLSFLESGSADLIIFNSVLEHLAHPEKILAEIYRVLDKNGTLFLNVPSWVGKYFLEMSAFKLHMSPSDEMDDHKMYYDKRDIWPLVVKAGFKPSDIRMKYHKFRLCTLCLAKK